MNLFNKKLNVLVIGSNGMLGHDLVEVLKKDSASKYGIINNVIGVDYETVDIVNIDSLMAYLNLSIHFDYVINCAAITDTKAIETNILARDKSFEVNVIGAKNLARICERYGMRLIHISTDYVFSELSRYLTIEDDSEVNSSSTVRSFEIFDQPYPVNLYGTHKLMAEREIESILDESKYTILRVSWLYGNHNHKSFVHKILKNAYNQSKIGATKFDCVDDEFSIPTSTISLSERILKVMELRISGIQHCADLKAPDELISRASFAEVILASFNSYTNDTIKIEVNKVGSKSGNMRYPKNSILGIASTDKALIESKWSWKTSLEHFISSNIGDLGNYIRQSDEV